MAVNAKQAAKRTLVKVLLALAAAYGLVLSITRESDDVAVGKAFRQELDLKDALAKRRPLSKIAYKQRVRAVCSTQTAQKVARNIANSLRKTCREVVQKKGAATRG